MHCWHGPRLIPQKTPLSSKKNQKFKQEAFGFLQGLVLGFCEGERPVTTGDKIEEKIILVLYDFVWVNILSCQ